MVCQQPHTHSHYTTISRGAISYNSNEMDQPGSMIFYTTQRGHITIPCWLNLLYKMQPDWINGGYQVCLYLVYCASSRLQLIHN